MSAPDRINNSFGSAVIDMLEALGLPHTQVTRVTLDRVTAQARERIARADGATLSLLLVERLPADVYIRHFDALLAAVRDLAHAPVGRTEPAMLRVMAAWDVIEDDAVTRIVDNRMREDA